MSPDPNLKPLQKAAHCGCAGGCSAVATAAAEIPSAYNLAQSDGVPVFLIPTMDCPNEENDIRRAVAGIEGIRSLRFQLSARTVLIDATTEALDVALAAIRNAGFDPKPVSAGQAANKNAGLSELWRSVLALGLAVGAEALDFFAPDTLPFKGFGMVLAIIAIWLSGISTYSKGVAALRRGQLNMNALMGVAVTGAFLIGQWPEAAMVMALYAIAELIEARSVDRARNAIKGLLDLTPETAEVRQADGTWLEVPAAEVTLESCVRVKPGARIPLDGQVTAGSSAVNQAPVTGESIPIDKVAGDPVFAGTINETGILEFRVTAAADNTTLARIIHAVEQAQGTQAPTQRFVDQFAAIYTPAVFCIALAVAILTPWLLGWTWTQAIYKALVLLVIACPCALVLATPVTVVSGLAAAARRGILIKGGVYLEEARKLRVIALDKTGTITEGKPRLVATELLPSTVPDPQVLAWAASLAGHSDHPVSKAIAIGLKLPENGLTDFVALAGRGIEARTDGQLLFLGNHRLVEERKLCSAEIEARLQVHETQGRTVTMLASAQQVLAIFAVADTIKESSREAVADLHRLGVVSVMLTGDNVATAASIAKEAGIDDARGNLLPEDKLTAIEDLQRRFGLTAMTGDGINDAPALARADIGVAMGAAGTDTAMEAADVVIMNDDLRRIPETIRLSRRTHAVLWQNIGLALGIKAIFLGLAVFGNATMWMAVFADMGASLLVVGNGVRILRWTSGKDFR
jgi:Cd2+/Zn2+-exporting ATPase